MSKIVITPIAALLLNVWITLAGAVPPLVTTGDRMLDHYFRAETATIARRCLADIHTLEDWTSRRAEYRRQLAEMLGLWPEPPRTDLKPVITGTIDNPDFTVEKLHLQSRPGLYVTCNLYLPKRQSAPCPAILYVCGHSRVQKDGISYGNKAWGQYYGEWLARNGYVCLITDTLELGEIDGIHHGLYRLGMWDWQSRGYTPAGVETWNSMRCLDYLQSRPEVDPERLGLMGRSGGGATTWYTAAMDERVKVAIPAAGITDLTNHVVDGTVEGHCDCMFMVNTYRWDFAQVAALVAPRALLFTNTDKDRIFPLDGVERLHAKLRDIYKLYGADDKLGLLITEGPHKDTQELQIPAFNWLNRFLKNDLTPLKDAQFESLYQPQQLRVFEPKHEPADQINFRIQSSFVAIAPPPVVPANAEEWAKLREYWLTELRTKTFGGWPTEEPPLAVRRICAADINGITLNGYEFTSQNEVQLSIYVAQRVGDAKSAGAMTLHVLDQTGWEEWAASVDEIAALDGRPTRAIRSDSKAVAALSAMLPSEAGASVAWFAPRGVGPTAWSGDVKRRTQVLRRFGLLGQTLDGQRVWDVRRAIQAARTLEDRPLTVAARGRSAAIVLYASLFEPNVTSLDLAKMPTSHRDGPELLNVLKTLDLPTAVAMAAERCRVHLTHSTKDDWDYPSQVAAKLKWSEDRLKIRATE